MNKTCKEPYYCTNSITIFNNLNNNNESDNIDTNLSHIIDSPQHVNHNYATIDTYNTPHDNSILLAPVDDIFDINNAINSFHTSAVKFTLSLLSKNNFSRKDVF